MHTICIAYFQTNPPSGPVEAVQLWWSRWRANGSENDQFHCPWRMICKPVTWYDMVHGLKLRYSRSWISFYIRNGTQIDEQIKSHRVSLGAAFVVSGWIEDDWRFLHISHRSSLGLHQHHSSHCKHKVVPQVVSWVALQFDQGSW